MNITHNMESVNMTSKFYLNCFYSYVMQAAENVVENQVLTLCETI